MVRVPRQVLVKAGLTFIEASKLLKKCEEHHTSGRVYDFFIMNNLSTSREVWGVYARPIGLEEYTDAELHIE